MNNPNPESTGDMQLRRTMWGGRFKSASAKPLQAISQSISFDHRFYSEDIQGSKAHAQMLARQGIISGDDNRQIQAGLDQVEAEIVEGSLPFTFELEDIHTHVEVRLRELIGDVAGRLHTGRSRNDQVATDLRLWLRSAIGRVDRGIADLQAALLDQAQRYAGTVMPGFTHMQIAQAVTFGHHLLAYVEMLGRDRTRLADCVARMNECPLGAAGMAGTAFPIDRHYSALLLGFSAPTENSMDSVGSRDHVGECLFCFAMLSVHLSRFAEEITLWTSDAFRFVTLSDAWTTGSSIFPQKRNPDAAELIRGKTGRMVGALNAILIVLKGLPMTFMKDMQEDKEPLFDASDNIMLCLAAASGIARDMKPDPVRMREFLNRGYPTATDLADWLVREAGVPFRDAHHVTGHVVAFAEQKGCRLEELTLAEFQAIDPRFNAGVVTVLSLDHSVASRTSYGGTSPDNVHKAVLRARERWLAEGLGGAGLMPRCMSSCSIREPDNSTT